MRRGVLLLPDDYSLWKRWEIFVRDNFRNRNQDVGMVAARRNGPAAGWSKAQGASQETMYALGLERTKVLRKVLSPLLTCWAKVECFFHHDDNAAAWQWCCCLLDGQRPEVALLDNEQVFCKIGMRCGVDDLSLERRKFLFRGWSVVV